MRPAEIDHLSRTKHFFDTSNGEVLAGKIALREYIAEGAERESIQDLGGLLREPPRVLRGLEFERLDTGDWPRDKYIQYGRWIRHLASSTDRRKNISRDILINASRLGVGPSYRKVRSTFTTLSRFYTELKAGDAHVMGNFKEWTLEDYIAYISHVGGKRRPTAEIFERRAKRDPTKPKATYMQHKFKEIGGFRKLIELAGYPVTDLWSRDDYIAWGVKVMQANDGMIPTSRMADYFSTKRLGPCTSLICTRFDRVGNYQREVIKAYEEAEAEKSRLTQEKLHMLKQDLRSRLVPFELFLPNESEEDLDLASMSFESLIEALGTKEALVRYAKYRVLQQVMPDYLTDSKITIARGEKSRSFIPSIKKNYEVSEGEVEHAALVSGFFDDIWPLDSHMETLKIGEDFVAYYKQKEKVKKVRVLAHISL